ncbi:hypothetical protein P154DRAFT_568987 [Amniculicola lignicola CBS 123094]|uniref:DUF7730 domain-containing protein n=1 Tax=Amniculicola lignicola CBS 123094 TaxID=1392246 RepID=A0A6A5X5Q0_9PLEO|nr:hypothetical protein P154DRAFT_568987 [Amniculicola lignicola CBS 123094]
MAATNIIVDTENSPPATLLPGPESTARQSRASVAVANAAEPPLLKLPAELRNHIYELVLGGQYIHVELNQRRHPNPDQSKNLNTDHLQLLARELGSPIPEKEAYRRANDPSFNQQLPGDDRSKHWRYGDPFHIENCNHRHERCAVDAPQFLNLGFLRTCSQVHQEAKKLPFTANTFAFRSPLMLQLFVFGLAPAQYTLLRSLSFDMQAGGHLPSRIYS